MNIPKFDFFRKKRKKIVEDAAEDFTAVVVREKQENAQEILGIVALALPCLMVLPSLSTAIKYIRVPSAAVDLHSPLGVKHSDKVFTCYIETVVINN